MLVVELLWPFAAGAIIGAAYFALMWWTLNQLIRARQPMRWVLWGAAVRIALVLPLFYLVMAEQWQRLLACLAGFVVVRTLTTLGRHDGMPPATRTTG